MSHVSVDQAREIARLADELKVAQTTLQKLAECSSDGLGFRFDQVGGFIWGDVKKVLGHQLTDNDMRRILTEALIAEVEDRVKAKQKELARVQTLPHQTDLEDAIAVADRVAAETGE